MELKRQKGVKKWIKCNVFASQFTGNQFIISMECFIVSGYFSDKYEFIFSKGGLRWFFAIFCILTISSSFLSAQVITENLQLEVTVKNIQNQKGKILIAIYNSTETFLKEPIQHKVISIEDEAKFPTSIQTVFKGLPAGEYAVSVYHDENENWKLDRNWLGIPKEMFGFSNDARAKFSPPTFNECSVGIFSDKSEVFGIMDGNKLEIRLKNW